MSSGNLPEHSRDERILAHVGLYHLSFRTILEQRFFQGRDARNVLGRLMAEGRLRSRPLGGGPLRYYQLTVREAVTRGTPHRAEPFGGRALAEAIAVLWFAAAARGRYRLERSELVHLLGPAAPKGPHVAEAGDPPHLFRVYVPGPQTQPRVIVKTIAAYAAAMAHDAVLDSWKQNRLYGVAVLVGDEPRRARLTIALERAQIPLEVITAYAPSPASVHDAIRSLPAH